MPRIPAKFHHEDQHPPSLTWQDAKTHLRHFAIISWAVDPEALSALLPKGFEPEIFTLASGRRVALISAVPFEDVDFHFHGFPFYKISMGQTNYRAYVIHQGKRVVWFFGTTLGGFWIRIPRDRWKLPWHAASLSFDVSYSDQNPEVCATYSLRALSQWAPMELDMVGTTTPLSTLDGFYNEEDTRVTLTHPLIGYYYRLDQRVGSYRVWHSPLELYVASVNHVRAHLFERLGLITAQTPVHSALIQRETLFHVYLPPTLVTQA